MKKSLIFAVALVSAVSLFGFPRGISYHGQLRAVNAPAFNGLLPIAMTFRIYDAASGGNVLWGRCIPVLVDKDGSFSLILSDDKGVPVSPAKYTKIEDACAGEKRWIGLTPGEDRSAREISPRQKISTTVAAARSVAAESADSARAPLVNIADMLEVGNLTVDSVNVVTENAATSPMGNANVTFDENVDTVTIRHSGSGTVILKNYYPGCRIISSSQIVHLQSAIDVFQLATNGVPAGVNIIGNYCTEMHHAADTVDTTGTPGNLAWIIGGAE